jgi:hypothetical protein
MPPTPLAEAPAAAGTRVTAASAIAAAAAKPVRLFIFQTSREWRSLPITAQQEHTTGRALRTVRRLTHREFSSNSRESFSRHRPNG